MSKSGQRLQDEGTRWQVVIAGATAGLISRFVIAPLDVVKIRLQLQSHSLSDPLSHSGLPRGSPVYKGTLATLRHILRHEGVPGLWKGNVPAELMYVSYAAVQFTSYRSITLLLHRVFGEGTLPKGVESFVSGTERVYTGLWRAIRDIQRDEGAKGFFRGIGPGIAQIVPYMGLFFAMYEGLRRPMGQLDLPFSSGDATAGVVASVVAKTGVFPLDLVRKRIQVQGPTRVRYVHKNIPLYESGMVEALRSIVAREGFKGLYRGLTVSLIKAAPASAVTMWTYERVLHLMIDKGQQQEEKV
ncbi:Mitochondrial thiamine pyrophosphate carrier 1 [Apiospora phragmitis]|uniref:Mitochondrial thiamine pyrophosphate carrier 1 n=1 Tax=Apiospora phragmitis TaxID=2905665 RepID=A0ABR1TT55_9PEZI